MRLFMQERGKNDIKKKNLGDIKETRIDMPKILQPPLVAENGMFTGCLKAFVPFTREMLTVEQSGNNAQYKRGKQELLNEKLIFGALTTHQVGYVSNVSVNFTKEEDVISKDTYLFKTMDPKDGLVRVDIESELYKMNKVNEYQLDDLDLTDQKCTFEVTLE